MPSKTNRPFLTKIWNRIGATFKRKRMEIFVIVQGGVVQEIINLPDHIIVTVIDYDVEDAPENRLQISPVDGELCVINKW